MRKLLIASGMIAILIPTNPAFAENWVYMGASSTGEPIYVDSDSISKGREGIRFIYRIGNETITAAANCRNNTWYALEYDQTYSPNSEASQEMLVYVCAPVN